MGAAAQQLACRKVRSGWETARIQKSGVEVNKKWVAIQNQTETTGSCEASTTYNLQMQDPLARKYFEGSCSDIDDNSDAEEEEEENSHTRLFTSFILS